MKKLAFLVLSGALLLGVAACENGAKTSADAPNSTNATNTQSPSAQTAQNSQKDATSDVRKAQLDSDIRAREQRNNTAGDKMKRADGDLESEVRSKLEANIPGGQLIVSAKDGGVKVSGTVPKQQQIDKISTLAKEIKGVQNVTVDVKATAN